MIIKTHFWVLVVSSMGRPISRCPSSKLGSKYSSGVMAVGLVWLKVWVINVCWNTHLLKTSKYLTFLNMSEVVIILDNIIVQWCFIYTHYLYFYNQSICNNVDKNMLHYLNKYIDTCIGKHHLYHKAWRQEDWTFLIKQVYWKWLLHVTWFIMSYKVNYQLTQIISYLSVSAIVITFDYPWKWNVLVKSIISLDWLFLLHNWVSYLVRKHLNYCLFYYKLDHNSILQFQEIETKIKSFQRGSYLSSNLNFKEASLQCKKENDLNSQGT